MPNMAVGINQAPYDCINDFCGVVSLLKRLLKGIWSKSNCFESFRTKNQCSGLKWLVEGKAWPTAQLYSFGVIYSQKRLLLVVVASNECFGVIWSQEKDC